MHYIESINEQEPDKLLFEGKLTIQHIQLLKQEVEQKLNFQKPLNIGVRKVVKLDLSFLQLLLALKKKYDKNAVPISVHVELSPEIENFLKITGLPRFIAANA